MRGHWLWGRPSQLGSNFQASQEPRGVGFYFFSFSFSFTIWKSRQQSQVLGAPLCETSCFSSLVRICPVFGHVIVGRSLDFNFLLFCGPLFSPSSPNVLASVNPGWKPQQIKVVSCVDCFQNKYRVVDNSAFGFRRAYSGGCRGQHLFLIRHPVKAKAK